MKRTVWAFASAGCLMLMLAAANPAMAQKQGGTLRVYHRDSPASMSIHEEGSVSVMHADDGGVQQSRALRSARPAKQPASRSCPNWRPAGRGARTGPS